MNDLISIEIENYRFYSNGTDCYTYNNENFMGIKFCTAKFNYDIFLNKSANWPRIYIIDKYPIPGEMAVKDLPLNDGTIKLLPECIKVEKIS